MMDPEGNTYETDTLRKMMDPEGNTYETDSMSVATVIALMDDQEEASTSRVEQSSFALDPEGLPGIPTSKAKEKEATHSAISWWNLESPIQYLFGSYNSSGTDRSVESIQPRQPEQQQQQEIPNTKDDHSLELHSKEVQLNKSTSEQGSHSQFSLHDDQHQRINRIDSGQEQKELSGVESYSWSSTDTYSSEDSSKRELPDQSRRDWKQSWANLVHQFGHLTVKLLTAIARIAAKNPYLCITFVVLLSIGTLAAGWMTNFQLVVENAELWPPKTSFSREQSRWLYQETNFNYEYRFIDMVIHNQGENVMTQDGVRRVFEALDVVRNMHDYQEGCSWAELVGDANQVGECQIHSVADFWDESEQFFDEEIFSDIQIPMVMSSSHYPTGQRVDHNRVIGNPRRDSTTGQLISAQSFLIEFDLPWSYETEEFELEALDALFKLQKEWENEPNNSFRVEVAAYRSYEDEFLRSIITDLPLLPGVFAVMSLFCCLAFWRRHKVHSRSLLGVGAVICIVLSIMTSFGLLFIIGIPFTTCTLMLPFLLFGVGLDDSFIIIGSYNRTQGTDILQRIETTMHDIGLSIFITTATSALAFGLGCFSAIPAVQWLCLYAFPSIVIDFFYQITFFIAILVLDQRRIQAGKWDCCVCVKANIDVRDQEETDDEILEIGGGKEVVYKEPLQEVHWADRVMGWYADKLLRPKSQKAVLVIFFTLLAGSAYSASQLRQYFDLNDMVPQDSYLRGYYTSLKRFGTTHTGLPSLAYFRNVNQSDPAVQQQMTDFLDDLVRGGAIASTPTNFWVRDFVSFTNSSALQELSFIDQVEAFMSVPLYHELYHDHIVRDPNTGEVIDSRCEIYIDVDLSDSRGGIAALKQLRDVAKEQPLNEGLQGQDWKLFTYQDQYHLWEFYAAVISELTFTTIMGVIAVSIIALVLIPHWTAVLFIAPLIICLYVDMLGYINYAKVHINAISYIQLVMSIGLMVDFIMHILMRYYESTGSRRERVKLTLETMGASIFVGGLSSLLGVGLLVFSTSQILQSVFVSVIGLVFLGLIHGLVFLPVILSLIGPE